MRLSRTLFYIAFFLACPLQAQYVFNYTDFKQAKDIYTERNTARAGKVMVLTPPEMGMLGGLWHAQKVKVRSGFSTSFSFRMHKSGSSFSSDQIGADGIAFVIHNNATATGVGQQGGGVGYEGIPNSIAIEFDNWRNDEWGEPNDNHVAVHTLGTSPNTSASSSIKAMNSTLPTQLENGEIHQVKIEFEKNILKVFLNGKEIISTPLDIGKTLNLDNETAWIGFTASTGAAYTQQEIHAWQFKGEAVKEPEKEEILENRKIVGKKIIKVQSPKVTLQVWDKGIEDGDIISLNFNHNWVLENYSLKRTKKSIEVNLSEADNLLVLHALNLGKIPPNTVILTVIDGKRTHQATLNSNMNASDSVILQYHPKK